jgi:hypothetical protein
MCALTFLPKPNQDWIITSNRDEGVARKPALPPQIMHTGKYQVLCPVDGEAGGTWFAQTSNGRTVALLNGAFIKHAHRPPYKKSRGKMLLESLEHASLPDFASRFDFRGIEPFTLVSFERMNEPAIHELRWDGVMQHTKTMLATEPMMWSSATLYDDAMRALRNSWFTNWVEQNPEFTLVAIREFHHFGGAEDETVNLVMNRPNGVRTVSITSLVVSTSEATMIHEDLLTGKLSRLSMNLDVPSTSPVNA